jgi:hypothetical protein
MRIRRDTLDRDGSLLARRSSTPSPPWMPTTAPRASSQPWPGVSGASNRSIAYAEDANTGYVGNGPQVMATLRNIAISLLHLAGITQITRTLQVFSRDPARILGLIPL